jgi:CubicO group peptidase (beta-lactamase class C family)
MQTNVRRLVIPIVLVLGLAGCAAAKPDSKIPSSSPSRSQARQSQAVLDGRAAEGEPGCSVAVAIKGEVVWQGVRGVADIDSGDPITPQTIFDIGSVSKQFTALAILLLQDAGKLSIDDKLSKYVKGLPKWADTVTLAQLMHHTSGIPDYVSILIKHNLESGDRVTNERSLAALHEIKTLTNVPGSTWEYSNSNYLLLGEVVHHVSGTTLPAYLAETVFKPSGLAMVVDAAGTIPGKAVSYSHTGATFEPQELRWEIIGAGGIQTTPTELAKWGDNYRTGAIGGQTVLDAQLKGAVLSSHGNGAPADPDQVVAYGAGIGQLPGKSLAHNGSWGGFVTWFEVSPDRHTSFAVACNRSDIDVSAIAVDLRRIWF